MNEDEEFTCVICGFILLFEQKGKAVNSKNKPINVCKWCCEEEQNKQFLTVL